jgi:hypothetical protein
MFKKTLKQLKYLLIIVIVIVCFPRSILPHKNSEIIKSVLDEYIRQNEKELRLIEFKDDEEDLILKLKQLQTINKSRKKFKSDEVKLDILSSRVANKICREAAENKYIGHWNLSGEKPYHRYAFAGGYDHVSENAFGEWTSSKYTLSKATISGLMNKGHNSFMSERAPSDGHKKNIIDKSHNFVGIGFYLNENQFRYYEEFVNRYFEFENIPSELKIGEQGSITFKTNGKIFSYFLIIFREEIPEPMNAEQLVKKGCYNDFSDEEYLRMPPWDIARYKNGSTYTIPLKFDREGVYYIQIYADKKEITDPGKADTKGKVIGSGIVITVVK